VNRLELPDVIIPFARERNLTFTLIANPEGDIAERYGAKNLPTSYFINSDGTINRHDDDQCRQCDDNGGRRKFRGALPTEQNKIDEGQQKAAVDAGVASAERELLTPQRYVVHLSADAVHSGVHLPVERRAGPEQHTCQDRSEQTNEGEAPRTSRPSRSRSLRAAISRRASSMISSLVRSMKPRCQRNRST